MKGILVTAALLATVVYLAFDELTDSLWSQYNDLRTLFSMLQQSWATTPESATCNLTNTVCQAAQKKSVSAILRKIVNKVNLARVWEPLVTTVSLFAALKFFVDIVDEDDAPEGRRNRARSTAFPSLLMLFIGETISYFSSTANILSVLIGIVQAVTVGKKITILMNLATYAQQLFLSGKQHLDCAASDERRNSLPVRRFGAECICRADQIKLGDILDLRFGDKTPAHVRIRAIQEQSSESSVAKDMQTKSNDEHIVREPDQEAMLAAIVSKDGPGLVGYHYARRQSGEDVSSSFGIGDLLGPGIEMTRPHCRVLCQVEGLLGREYSARPSRPTFLDLPVFVSDVISLLLIGALAFNIASAAAIASLTPEMLETVSSSPKADINFPMLNETTEFESNRSVLREVGFYFIAAIGSMPSVIPGLKFVVMHLAFCLVVRAAFWRVTVQQHSGLEKIQDVCCVTFDKTGTLTDHLVFHVHAWYPITKGLEGLQALVKWSSAELLCALTLANSESSVLVGDALEEIRNEHAIRPPLGGQCGADKDGVWGVSPEENEMLRWWQRSEKLEILANPLKGEYADKKTGRGCASFRVQGGPIRRLWINSRTPYAFQIGKIAHVSFEQDGELVDVVVRQTGWSFLIQEVDDPLLKSDMSAWAEHDPRRAMGLAYCIENRATPSGENSPPRRSSRSVVAFHRQVSSASSDGLGSLPWQSVGAFTFENPVRPGVLNIVELMRKQLHIGPGMLTGDAQEAAEAIARTAGICPRGDVIHRLTETGGRLEVSGLDCEDVAREPLDFANLLTSDEWHTVSVEGSVLKRCMDNPGGREDVRNMLTHRRLNRIMFRAAEKVKELVTVEARSLGPVMHIGDAANDAPALGAADVGVCMQHGADISKTHSKLVVHTPQDLVDVMSPNGFADMIVVGSQRLFSDICSLSGFTASIYLFGVFDKNFGLLIDRNTGKPLPMFQDIWKDEHYWLMSNLYILSLFPYASADCVWERRKGVAHMAISSLFWLFSSLGLGMVVGYILKNWSSTTDYGFVGIHMITIMYLLKHSWHCILRHQRVDMKVIADQRTVVGFGPHFRSKHSSDLICRILSRFDSVMFRMILYWFFTAFSFHTSKRSRAMT